MSTSKVGGGGSAPRPSPPPKPKPAAPSSSSSSTAKASTPAVKPTSSTSSAGTGSTSKGSSSTGSTTSAGTSAAEKSKSTDTSSTSSTSKDDDKDSSSTSTEDKFEKSKEAKTEDSKKGKETFNDRFIDNLRKSYEPESSDVKDKIGQVEQQLSKDNFSALEGKDAIKNLESTAADLKDGSRKDKLEARVTELKKEVAARERSEDKVKAADARDTKESESRTKDTAKVQKAGGVESDVKTKLKDERQRLNQPKENDELGSKPPAGNKSIARAGENDPEVQQIAKQRQLEAAEVEARQRISDYRENNNQEAMANVQGAYDTALANRDQTIQSLKQELSGYYPADRASELAQQAMTSKENFYSSFGSLHSLGNKSTQDSFSKLNPEAAKLFSHENSLSAAGPEERLGQMRENLRNRAAGTTENTSGSNPEDTVGQLERSVAEMANTRESALRGRVRDLKDASEAKDQKTKGVAEQSEDKTARLKDEEKKLGGAAAAEKSLQGPSGSGKGENKPEPKQVEAVAKDDKEAKPVSAEPKKADKPEPKQVAAVAKDDKEAKPVSAEPKKADKPEPKQVEAAVAKDDKEAKPVSAEPKKADKPEPKQVEAAVAKDDKEAKPVSAEPKKADKAEPKQVAAVAKDEKEAKPVSAEPKKADKAEPKQVDEAVAKDEKEAKPVSAEPKKADKAEPKQVDEAVAKDDKEAKPVSAEPKKADKAEPKQVDEAVAKDDKEAKPVSAEPKKADKPETKQVAAVAKDEKEAKPVSAEPKKADKPETKQVEAVAKDDKEANPVSAEPKKAGAKDIQGAYDAAMADRDKTIQTLEKELTSFYPAEKASELAQQAVSSKEDFYAHYGALHSIGDQSTKDNLAKVNPAAAKLFEPKAASAEARGGFKAVQREAFGQKSDLSFGSKDADFVPRQSKMSPRGPVPKEQERNRSLEVGPVDKTISEKKAVKIDKLDGAEKTAAKADIEPAQGDSKKIADETKTDRALDDTKKIDKVGQLDDAGAAGAGAIGQALGGALAEGSKIVSKATEAVTSKIADAMGGLFGSKSETVGEGGKLGVQQKVAAGSESKKTGTEALAESETPAARSTGESTEPKATGETPQAGESTEPKATGETPQTEKAKATSETPQEEKTEELTDGQRRLKASQDEAQTRLDEYRKNEDTEALASIDSAYERAQKNPEETKKVLEEQLAKVYPEDKAKEMAEKALESKDGFYSQYSSLQRNAADDESKKALEKVNPEAADLAAKEQKETLPDAATQTGEEQVKTVSEAIQSSFQEKVKADPENFKKQLQEAYPEADEKTITDLMKQAEDGKFPVPKDIKFVAGDDDALGSQSSRYDADKKQLVLSEELKHNPAALQKAMLEGTASHLDQKMGVEKGFLAAFNLSGEKDQHGAKLVTQVQDEVASRSNAEAVARTKAFEEATADPETRQKTQDALRTELEQRFTERFKEEGFSDRVASYRARVRSGFIAHHAMKDADSFDSVFNRMYEKGDPAARERMKELNPTMAALAESRLNTPKEEQALTVQETGAATAYERYRDAKSDGPHLDPIHDVSKGFSRATRDDAKPTTDALQKIYEERGLGPERALQKAQEAVSSEKGLYSQYSALWKTADEKGKERLKELNPELAGLMEREKAGTLKSDEQWRQDVRDSHKTPLIGDWLANNTIKKAEAKLTTTSQSDEQRNLASTFQSAIKDRANEDPTKFAQDLRTAFPKAEQETIDGLVQLAKDGNFPLAQKVNFVDKDDPLLNGENASYDSQSKNIYIDKELLKDPSKVLSAYVEENGHHLDKLLGGGDSQGDEGELLEKSVLKSGGISFLDKARAKVEDDFEIVIGDDGVVKVIENQTNLPGPINPNPGPVTPGPITPGGPKTGPITPKPGPVTPGPVTPGPVTPGPVTPGPVTPGPVTPGPVTPGPVTPGPVTPGPVTPGPVTPSPVTPSPVTPSPVTPGPSTPTPSPVTPNPVNSQPISSPIPSTPSPVSPSPDLSSPKPSPVEPSRDNWKPARNLRTPDVAQEVREANEAREANREKEFKANFDPNDIRNLDELKRLDDVMAKLKDLPKALDQLDKIKEALKGGKGLSESLSDLKNLTKTMENLKGLSGNLDSLERLGKLQHQLKDLPQKLANMETLPSALETLGNLNKSMTDLQKLPKMLEQLRDLPRQMSQLEQLPNTLNKFNKLPDNINDLGRLSGFLDAARDVPGKQVKTNGARAVAADRILSGKIIGARPVKGGKTGPKVPGSGQVAGPSGAETGGKANRIAGGGSTVPYVGRFGGSAGLGPSIGRDASRQTQSRPGSSRASKTVSKAGGAGGLGGAGSVGGTGKSAPGLAIGGSKNVPLQTAAGTFKGAPKTGTLGAAGPKGSLPGAQPAPGLASPNPVAKPGRNIANPAVGPNLGGSPGVGAPRPTGKPGTPVGRAGAAGVPGASAPASKAAPSQLPAAEYQQLSQRMNTAGVRPENNSLSRLQNMLTGPSDGTRQLPGVLKSLENLPKNMSSVSRLNGLLGKREGLAKGVAGLAGLAEIAKSSSGTMKNLDGLSSLLNSVQSSPDAYSGLKRMPGLINHMGGIQGDNNPEAMSRLLKTVQNRPDALEGLKTFQNLMSTLQKPEMARSLEQLNKMVQSGQLDKLAQSGQKLAMDLQKPQAVFGMDKLESLFFKAKNNPEAMKGLDRLGQMLGGRERQGAAIGVDRLGSLLQTAKAQPSMMRQIVERVAQPTQGQTASTTQPTSKGPAGTPAASAANPAGFEAGAAVTNRRGLDRRGGDRRASDRRVGAAGRVGASSGAASAGAAGGAKSPGRLRDYRQIFNMLSEVGQGKPTAVEHPAKLAEMSRGTQGAHAVADAMEAQVVAKPDRMLDTLQGMTKTSESRQSFGKTLSNMAEATPDRLVGILLLTSDVAGGQQAVANMFGQLAADPQSAGSLGKVIGASTRTETGAAGMKDLLSNLMAQDDNGDYTRATKTAQTFASASRSKAGARGLAEGLTNMTTLSGGAREVGGMVRQMSRTKDGARATGELLMNMASDRQGAKDLGKVLARASKSSAGSRDLLASFAKIAQTDAGRNDVSRLMVRLTESEHGAKMLNHMARDRGNAKSLAGLLNQVAESPQAATRMNFALERALHNPQARTEMQVFRGRMASDVGLREAVDRLTQAPTQSQPLQQSQSVKGADALARVTAFENLARAVGERPVESPIRTVDAAGSSSSGGTTDGSQNQGQQNSENRPFPNQTQPYPDLAAVSDVWRNQSLKPEGGERLAEQAQGSAAAEAEGEDSRRTDNQKSAFRPGDVYSDLTLLRARICGDCGFRTNAMGKCGRCGFNLLQETPRIEPA